MSEKNEITNVTQNNAPHLLKELEDAFYDIPFGNSAFQSRHFVFASNITPERAYRSLGLEIMSNIKALRENIIGLEISDIKYEKAVHELENEKDPFERKIKELNLKMYDHNKYDLKKQINDRLVELNVLYAEFKKLPKFTREQFENGEKRYYLENLNRQVNKITGASQALHNLAEDYTALTNFGNEFKKLEKDSVNSDELKYLYDKALNNMQTKDLYLKLEEQNKKLENKE